jgi:hypothetical protein
MCFLPSRGRGTEGVRLLHAGITFGDPLTGTQQRQSKPCAFQRMVCFVFAEKGGFEPPVPRKQDNGFRDRRIRPLCHLSLLILSRIHHGVYPASAGPSLRVFGSTSLRVFGSSGLQVFRLTDSQTHRLTDSQGANINHYRDTTNLPLRILPCCSTVRIYTPRSKLLISSFTGWAS